LKEYFTFNIHPKVGLEAESSLNYKNQIFKAGFLIRLGRSLAWIKLS